MLSRSFLAKCSDSAQLKRSGLVTGPFSCCLRVCWLTWVWFLVLLKLWVGQRPGGTEGTSTGASSLMTVKRRRDLSKHLSSLASLLDLCFKLCTTAPAQTGKDPVTGQPMNICPRFERPIRWSQLGLDRYVVSFWGPNLFKIGLFHSKAIVLMKALKEYKQWNVATLHNCN